MKTLEFKIDIQASRKKVWETMLDKDTYKEWVGVSWPDSYYVGEWKEGNDLKFITPDESGTLVNLIKHKPYEVSYAKHIAVLNPGGEEDRESEVAKGWIGTTERYTFTEIKNGTELKIEITTNPDWAKMFNDGWVNALAKLKEMCEN
jgi:uncharacterized protein YndB with AHSA1/START domain